jgi:nicotinamidase/pyrazinamidase
MGAPLIDSDRVGLLVVDVQNDFCSGGALAVPNGDHDGPWAAHCVQGTDGARFHPNLRLPVTAIVVTKGEDPNSSGYSAFEGRTPEGKPFLTDPRERGIRHLYVGGLATDYCVKHSVLDALLAGLQVTVLEDAIAGVERENSARAIVEMRERGAQVATGADVLVSNR